MLASRFAFGKKAAPPVAEHGVPVFWAVACVVLLWLVVAWVAGHILSMMIAAEVKKQMEKHVDVAATAAASAAARATASAVAGTEARRRERVVEFDGKSVKPVKKPVDVAGTKELEEFVRTSQKSWPYHRRATSPRKLAWSAHYDTKKAGR